MTALEALWVFLLAWLVYAFAYVRGHRQGRQEPEVQIPSLDVLRVKPGDMVCITCPFSLTQGQIDSLRKRAAEMFNDGSDVTVVLLDAGMRIEITPPQGAHEHDRRRKVGEGKPVQWEDTQPGGEA